MKHLIIGAGEIGSALQSIFMCDIRDIKSDLTGLYDVIHIAYPYFKGFEKSVKAYKKMYGAEFVVIHSTVPVGTCKKISAIHSPVTGVHPHLRQSILTFTKFVSNEIMTEEFKDYGIPAKFIANSSETEAGKLFALLIYGINVLLEKEIFEYCKKKKLAFHNVYEEIVKMYNRGYADMDMHHYQMYELLHKDGGIGGHCVIQNAPLLKTRFAKLLKNYNNKFVV